jgi:phosphatidylserine decarboxylase
MSIARAAGPYLAWTLGAAALLLAGWHFLGWSVLGSGFTAAMVLALSVVWFFRDPVRKRPPDSGLLLSPADGIVHRFHSDGGTRTIEIFLRIWDVHIQRAPADGRVVSVRYTKGGYLPANVRAAGTRNTRCETVFTTRRGRITVLQVAGLIARKVEAWTRRGQKVSQGERIGIIHMGSQCRLTMPKGARILVRKGRKVYGGLTPLARLGR